MSLVIHQKIYKNRDWGYGNAFLLKYLPYWPLFLFLTFFALASSWAYLNFADRVYKINAKILIKDGGNGFADANKSDLTIKKSIDKEIQLVQTRNLLNAVVKSLNLYAPVFQEERFKSVSAYHSSPIIIIADLNNIKETSKVYFTLDKNSIHLNKMIYPLNEWVNTPYGKLKFKKNRFQLEQTNKRLYFSLISPNKVAASIALRLKVIADERTPGIVTINFTDEVPLRGEDIVKEFIRGFNKAIIEKQNELVNNKARLIDGQLASVENDLLSIENKLLYSKLPKTITAVGSKEKKFLANINTNNHKADQINSKIKTITEIENAVEAKDLSVLTIPLIVKLAIPGLTQMAAKINHLQTEAERLKKTAGERSSIYVSNQERIEKIRSQILKNTQKQINSLRASRNYLLQKNNSYLSALVSRLGKPGQLLNIKREQAIKKEDYVHLLQQKEEIVLASVSNSNAITSQIIESVNPYPTNPNQKFIYWSAVFTALITGFGVIVKKENLSSTVMFQKDIEQITKLPVIGEIATEKAKKGLWIRSNTKINMLDQFRKLRASLNYLIMDTRQKRILITSAIAGEGKSFVAQNLAISQSQTGKNVALLSLCSNQPVAINKIDAGLADFEVTEYLPGTVAHEKIMRPVTIDKSLFLISDGKISENFSNLLKNLKITELLNYLDEKFDCVIIDTATFDTVSDAYALSTICDATLCVVRQAYTPKAIIEGLDKEKLYNAAIVFNGVKHINITST